MKIDKEIEEHKEKNWGLWWNTRCKVFDELSDKQEILCCCGRLASGMHEMNCRKFAKKVDKETAIRLRANALPLPPVKE